MKCRYGIPSFCTILLVMVMLMGCGVLPGGNKNAGSPTSTVSVNGQSGGSNVVPGGTHNNVPSTVTPTAIPTATPTPTSPPTPTPVPTPTITPGGPYLVKQTMTRGDETLVSPAGGICTNSIWRVPVNTSTIQFLMVFDPHGVYPGINGNTFGYYYTFPSLGESHHAEGSYTLTSKPGGSVTVSISAQDHVVFNGFDGNVPLSYQFDLVPMGSGNCNS